MGAYTPNPTGHDDWYEGRIDAIRVSSGARYSSSFSPATMLEADSQTLALWSLEEGTGTSVQDASGNGHNGTIHGAAWTMIDGPVPSASFSWGAIKAHF